MPVAEAPYTASRAILEAMREAGVRYLFANLGSDHTGIVEAYAQARRDGRAGAFPELVLCPHEFVALSAAQGYAQASGEAQAVLVHVDCGTQNLGGAVHNAARGRVPVLILAGLSPMTGGGELPGSRNEFIHWLQDTADQRGLVRGYVKYEHEIRTGRNAKQIVHRALQIARSEPAGPVYLTAAREVLEETLPPQPAAAQWWTPVAPAALAPQVADQIAAAIEGAGNPLVVTSYLGRDPGAVASLVRLCELAAIPVIESVPMWMNFPADHPLHWGYQWNTAAQNPLLAAADVVLVVGSDVPWIPATNRPSPDARVYVLDVDPIKEQMPLWHVPATRYARADLAIALDQVSARLAGRGALDQADVRARAERAAAVHDAQRARWAGRERPAADGSITPEYLVACVREAIGPDALVLTEAITNFPIVCEHLRPSRPGSLMGSGGSSLGWAGGAAVGAKLADPGRTVVSLVGDGSYLFGVPSTAQWMARRYAAPSLTVIFDNQGWAAPALSALAVHPAGATAAVGARTGFGPEADLPRVAAAAGGAYAATVSQAGKLPAALSRALTQVHRGRSAVVSVHVPSAAPPPTGSHIPARSTPGRRRHPHGPARQQGRPDHRR
jgi:acetolactate synthase-1/2/3 large subunit